MEDKTVGVLKSAGFGGRMNRCVVAAIIALNFCGSLFAASSVTETDIYSWLALWQKREGLERRNIHLRVVRQSEMPRNVIGDVEWWRTPGKANIRIVRGADLERVYGDTPAEARSDAELTVIHELTHLVLSGLYDDGSGRGSALLDANRPGDARMEAITGNLAVMLQRRRPPGGVSLARYVGGQVNSGPWNPAPDVKERIVLQIVHAMNAATEDDVMVLFARELGRRKDGHQ